MGSAGERCMAISVAVAVGDKLADAFRPSVDSGETEYSKLRRAKNRARRWDLW